MRFDLSLLRCVVSLGVFVGLTASTAGTAFAETRLAVVTHDCPNGDQIASLASQWSTAYAVNDESYYDISKQAAAQEFICSSNANVNDYSRGLAKLLYANDLAVYAGDDNLSESKRYDLYLHTQFVYKELEKSVYPDIAEAAKGSLPPINSQIKITATLL